MVLLLVLLVWSSTKCTGEDVVHFKNGGEAAFRAISSRHLLLAQVLHSLQLRLLLLILSHSISTFLFHTSERARERVRKIKSTRAPAEGPTIADLQSCKGSSRAALYGMKKKVRQ